MSHNRYPCPRCGVSVTPADRVCPQCGQPLDPATVIYSPEDAAPANASVTAPLEETPRDAATAIVPLDEGVPADASASTSAEEMPRDAPTTILPSDEIAPADASVATPPDDSAPEQIEDSRPLPPELTPVEEGALLVAEPPVPSGRTPSSGMTTPFPPEEIEAEARLPHQDTDRNGALSALATQPRLRDETALPPRAEGVTTPHRLTVEPPRQVLPPPPFIAPPVPAYTAPRFEPQHPFAAGLAYLQQRANAYLRGGYRLHQRTQTAAILSRGKSLGVGGWFLALLTGIGLAWYLLLLVFSGLRADRVFITLESDGLVYEDGSGAAHVRRARARAGRRWALFGAAVFALSLLLALMLGAVAAVYLRVETNRAALREAYPAITLFEERFSAVQADPDDVALARDGFVAWVILAGVAVVGLWGGATLFVVGTIHHSAYRVSVPPLPGWG